MWPNPTFNRTRRREPSFFASVGGGGPVNSALGFVIASTPMIVRSAVASDAPAILRIYAPVVRETAISFELEPPTLEEMIARIERCTAKWSWLVAEEAGCLLGYAYGASHRERAAYQWSTEVSAYVAEEAKGRGVGRSLYNALFPSLAGRGYFNAYAGIALPNEASVKFHEALGFQSIGIFPSVGFKHGAWRDVGWFHKPLRQPATPSRAPSEA